MKKTLRVLAVLSSVASSSCYSPAFFPVIHSGSQSGPVRGIEFYEHPPSFSRKPSDWRCIRFYESCLVGAPIACEFTWTSKGPSRVECTFLNRDEYYDSLKMVMCADETAVAGLTYRPHPTTIVWRTEDVRVRLGLEVVWRQLTSYDYYDALCWDGCGYSIEVYSRQGIVRRMELSSPVEPQFGSDITRALSIIMEAAVKSKIGRAAYETAFSPEYDIDGVASYRSASDLLRHLHEVIPNSVTNERKVMDYRRPPCEPQSVVGSDVEDYEAFLRRTEGCMIVPQPVSKKEYSRR